MIVIGVDGATLSLLDPWMDEGKLPHFTEIRNQGVSGVLYSTNPPYSAPAWVSIVTGVHPGKHGIYDFFRTDCFSKKLISSHYRKASAIWNFLSDVGKKSIIVNVPGAYPPEQIQGVMISGLLTPSQDSTFTYPESIRKDLVEGKLGRYDLEQVAVDDLPKNLAARYAPQKLVDQINAATCSHGTVTLNLMRQFDWDFSMVVFRGIDDVQHLLWNKKDCVLSCYQHVDSFIGQLRNAAPDAFVILVSDHGFYQPQKYLYVNNVLFNEGYLKTFSDPRSSRQSRVLTLFDKLSRFLYPFIPWRSLARSSFGRKLIFSSGSESNIDMSKSKAVYHSVCSRGIRITVNGDKESEYDVIRAALVKLFSELRDPESGKRIVKAVHRWEDIYGSDAVNHPLDVILEMETGYGAQELLGVPRGTVSTQIESSQLPILASPGFYDWIGDHASEGIVFMVGPGVKSHHRLSGSVVDVVPTVLACLDTPLPDSLDGKVLFDAFLSAPSVETIRWSSRYALQTPLSERELEKIKELRAKL